MHTIFVYGTLKYGQNNYRNFLQQAEYLGSATTFDSTYEMTNAGCVGVFKNGKYKIRGDVFQVDDNTLRNLDMLENNGIMYTRRKVKILLDSGEIIQAWLYFMHRYYLQKAGANRYEIKETNGVLNWKEDENSFLRIIRRNR